MSHNLNINENGKASVMYVGGSAWHQLGQQLESPATADQAIKEGGLDFDVIKAPLIAQTSDGFSDVDGYFANIRQDSGAVLGIVGKGYKIVQNRDAFNFFDPIVDRDEAVYHSAGVIGAGEKIWIQAKMPEHIQVGKNDLTEMYVTLYNSHNGQGAIRAYFTPVRIVCENTLRLSMKQMADSVSIRHTMNVDDRLKQAAEILGLQKRYAKELESAFSFMSRQKLSDMDVDLFLQYAFPMQKTESSRTLNNRQRLLETIESGRGQKEAGSGSKWWLFNGYTRFLEDQGSRDKSREVDSLLTGTIHRQRQDAYEYIMAI